MKQRRKSQLSARTVDLDRHNVWIATYLALGVAAFILFAALVKLSPHFEYDDDLTRALQVHGTPELHLVMFAISWLGFSPQAAIVAALINIVIFYRNYRWEAAVGLVSAAMIYAINTFTKEVVYRPRPTLNQVLHIFTPLEDSSFPSGHVSSFVALGGFMIFLAFTLCKPVRLRVALIALCAFLIVLMAVARIYSGEHWPSDVVASLLLGSLWLVVTIWIYRWGRGRKLAQILQGKR